jgi:hypothetical protein
MDPRGRDLEMKTSDVGNLLSESEHSFTIATVRSLRPPGIVYQCENFGKIYQPGFLPETKFIFGVKLDGDSGR